MGEITFMTADGKKVTASLNVMRRCKSVEVYFIENKSEGEMLLPKVDADTLAKIVQFCEQYQDKPLPVVEKPIQSSKLEDCVKDEWLCKFLDMPLKDLNELLTASNYMSLKPLEEFIACLIATKIFGKSTEEIRKDFGITNDFTSDEEKQLQEFFDWADNIWYCAFNY
eukprot:TRINITY_DN4265_c0_g3_i1.p2 TRINITY_DN4265_c0_g3~~TRINITY_DN4265_c0_g3_i1.p2  ORF type:complete len:168 (-),score=65.46 TRINITY_DN4265_c0_g3_i1:901-1404(-)